MASHLTRSLLAAVQQALILRAHTVREGVALVQEFVAAIKTIGILTTRMDPTEIEGGKWQLLSLEFHLPPLVL